MAIAGKAGIPGTRWQAVKPLRVTRVHQRVQQPHALQPELNLGVHASASNSWNVFRG